MPPATDPRSASIVVTKRKKPHRLVAQPVSIPDTVSVKPRDAVDLNGVGQRIVTVCKLWQFQSPRCVPSTTRRFSAAPRRSHTEEQTKVCGESAVSRPPL